MLVRRSDSLVLDTLRETQRLRGSPKIESTIVDAPTPTRAVLARTDAGVIVEVLNAVRAGHKPTFSLTGIFPALASASVSDVFPDAFA
jgi:hypothetical protein